MADNWETPHGCVRRCHASLARFSRAFDKVSIKNWGTGEHEAPTLRIIASDGVCQGIAFQFYETSRPQVVAYLRRREGEGCPLREKQIQLDDSDTVTALVPMYEGHRIITGKSLSAIAAMSIAATGTMGTGVQYVRDVAAHLERAGVKDAAVTELLAEIEKQLRK